MRVRQTLRRNRRHVALHGHDRWMISYADFITLLFVFFVVMYSLSSAREGEYKLLSESILEAFSKKTTNQNKIEADTGVGMGNESVPEEVDKTEIIDVVDSSSKPSILDSEKVEESQLEESPAKNTREDVRIKRMADSVEQAMAPWIDKGVINIEKSPVWLQIDINASALFSSGSATISTEAVTILRDIAKVLSPFDNAIHVEGFTDSVPIQNNEFSSNWELSVARSASIVRLFQQNSIDPTRMAAMGYAEFKPVASNTTAQGRNRNRRVVIVVLSGNDPRNFIDIIE